MQPDFAMADEKSEKVSAFTLHPVRGVLCAAFCGSFLAAGIVMAINYARMGRKAAARATLAGAILATAALFALILAIPEDLDVPGAVLYIPQLVVIYAIATKLQGAEIEQHAERGGTVASAWPSAGIGFVCLPLMLGVLFGALLLLEPSPGTLVEFGDDEIYCAGDATEDDALKLAEVLKRVGFFNAGGHRSDSSRHPAKPRFRSC